MSAVWSFGVVHVKPLAGDDRGFNQGGEYLGIEDLQLVGADKALGMAVLPRLAWFNVRQVDLPATGPALHDVGDELSSVVTADVPRSAVAFHQLVENILDINAFERPGHADVQAVGCCLVLDDQGVDLPSVHESILGKVHAPDIVYHFGYRTNTLTGPHLPPTLSPLCGVACLPVDPSNAALGVRVVVFTHPAMDQADAPGRMLLDHIVDHGQHLSILGRLSVLIGEHRA